ncbi:MAG: efflux RND transporter periplasmic adaptor subunit [Litorimonas sp.]
MHKIPFLTVCLVGLCACSGEPEVEAPGPRTVEVIRVVASSSSFVSYPAVLRASERSELGFEAGGTIVSLSVDRGDSFANGAVLGVVDTQQARLEIQGREAERRAAETDLRDAELDYDRKNALSGTGAIAQSQIDVALARRDAAQARLDTVNAALGQARKRLADTRLIAPFTGQVVERLVEPSTTVAPGQAVLSVIGRDAGLEAMVNLPQSLLDQFDTTETHIIRVDGQDRQATLDEMGSSANAAGLYPVTLSLKDNTEGLRSGQRAELQLTRNAEGQVLRIPLTAYRPVSGNQGEVMIVDPEGGSLVARRVSLGDVSSQGVEVLSGLAPGDVIVAKGVSLLRVGETVRTSGIDGVTARFNQ